MAVGPGCRGMARMKVLLVKEARAGDPQRMVANFFDSCFNSVQRSWREGFLRRTGIWRCCAPASPEIMLPDERTETRAPQPGWFATTHWSVVLAAGQTASPQAEEALEKLCRAYWYPLYAYVRRQGFSPEDAQDLTQEFFARFLQKKSFRRADRERGKFRTFLLTSLQHFLAHEWERARAQKRGGGQPLLPWDERSAESRYQLDATPDLAPDQVFDQRWALTLFQQALTRLHQEFAAEGKSQ